ncbi:hypothetical protein HNQ07_004245 [Deinococcus metalli]|uniref:Uncharacterized protein n=1 Tax=Deinococcus metalli TaxID=1141878 RepID=A0A7W8NT58_9DEIO|nr:hypothetical protein [Deinococcus metalli]MBB5378738.1 hypothetical protein [Deinococcus metalli]GHF60319.1 hypothetical protein GCM10017781_40610 [Deinococcus metalli]
MLEPDHLRRALIEEMFQWGPALVGDVRARYPATLVRELVTLAILARRKFRGFEVYVLSGKGLRPYGLALRYNYVPARSTVLGSLILRAQARVWQEAGYRVEPYEEYTKKGRGNLALARRDDELVALVGRPSLTIRALRMIADHLAEQTPTVRRLQVYIVPGDHDPVLLSAQTVSGLPVTITELPLSSVTRYTPDGVTDDLQTATA